MLKTALTGLLMLTLLTSCTNGSEIDWCHEDSPILVSKQDKLTAGTGRQILRHNVVGTAACGWDRI